MAFKLEYHLSRRCFLKGASGVALSIPFLHSLAPSSVLAQVNSAPKRLITFRTQNGEYAKTWFPTVPADQVLAPNVKARALSSVAGPISDQIGADFNEFKSKLLIIKGLDLLAGGHDRNSRTLSGYIADDHLGRGVGHISLDQILAFSSKFYPSVPAKRIVHLCTPFDRTGLSVTKIGDQFHRPKAMGRAQVAYDSIFSDLLKSPDQQARQRLAANRRSLLDLVNSEFKSLQSSRRISSADKHLVEQHADHLRDLEQGIAGLGDLTCELFARPEDPKDLGELSDADYGTYHVMNTNAMMDIAALAIRCGITQIVNFHFYRGDDYRWLPFRHRAGHHGLSHNINDSDDSRGKWLAVARYNMQILTNLLKKLDVPDSNGNGTVLDNSLVYIAAELGNAQEHSGLAVPIILAGGLGGKIKMDRYIDYTTNLRYKRRDIGRPYNELFNTIFQAFGLQPSEYEQGQQGFGHFGRPENDRMKLYDLTDKRRVLPFVLS